MEDLEAAAAETLVPSDREVLETAAAAAARRAPGAFDELVRLLGGRLAGYANGILRDRGLAEEAVQETLIRIYRFLPRYAESNFLAWSFTIANRVCSNLIRRERRHARLRLAVRPAEPLEDPAPNVGTRVALQTALAQLPPHLREVFLLHEQGLSYEEIAQVVEVPVGTVRSRLFRARDALRKSLHSERT